MPAVALAQSPPEEVGSAEDAARYTLDRNGDDLIRVDKTTGAISTCIKREAGWACQATPEERAAYESEIARLQDENAALKRQLANAQPRETAKPVESKPAAPKGYRVPDAQLRLPTNEDIDRALALAGRVWKRLADMLNDVRIDIREKI
jgi:hypothetical protein